MGTKWNRWLTTSATAATGVPSRALGTPHANLIITDGYDILRIRPFGSNDDATSELTIWSVEVDDPNEAKLYMAIELSDGQTPATITVTLGSGGGIAGSKVAGLADLFADTIDNVTAIGTYQTALMPVLDSMLTTPATPDYLGALQIFADGTPANGYAEILIRCTTMYGIVPVFATPSAGNINCAYKLETMRK